MPNIKDIAKKAGVSTSTVSRVINNNPAISDETRNHIQKVMQENDYVPNSMARGLSTQKASSVALLVDIEDEKTFDSPFFYKSMYGIETVVYKHGLSLVVANLKTSLNGFERLNWMVQGKYTQGVILPSSILNTSLIKKLKALDFPFVALGEPENVTASIDWVDINNSQGGQQAVAHLVESGYQRIAFLSGNMRDIFNRNRIAGYRTMLSRYGMPIEDSLIAECDGSKGTAYDAVLQLLNLPSPPDSIICGDNTISVGAMRAIAAKGLEIPKDIGVISFDNFPIAELVEPSLTTVDVNVFEMGVQAAILLLRRMGDSTASHQVSLISTEIQVRESTTR